MTDRFTNYGDTMPAPRPPQALATYALIGVSIVVALVSRLGDDLDVLSWLTVADLHRTDRSISGGLADIAHGQLWRLISPIFIHFGMMHLVFNMLWLKDLGSLIELRWRRSTLLALVAVSAVLANLAQFAVNWDYKHGLRFANALSGGMSGVVYCLLGYVWMRAVFDRTSGIRINQSTVWLMIGWLVLCTTGIIGYVGNTAHAVGLLVGVVWGRIAAFNASAKLGA